MKKYLYFLTAAAFMLAACNKNDAPVGEVENKAPETGALVVSVSSESQNTKANSTLTDESKVNTLQVFVFEATTGKLETDKYEANTKTITLSTLTGVKHVWAIANAPKIILNKDALESVLASKISNLGENTITGLTMVGVSAPASPGSIPFTPGNITVGAYTVGATETITAVPINIYRLGARISLEKVTVDFTGTSLEGKSFSIRDIYLKNVVNGLRFDGQPADLNDAGYWTNRVADHAPNGGNYYLDKAGNNVASLICDKGLSLDAAVTDGSSALTVNKYWYVYPNPRTEDSNAVTWSPRRTRLVIHAVVGGDIHTYYQFDVPPAGIASATDKMILNNHTYDISNIKITMLGKDDDDDDDPTEIGKASITVTVSDWAANYSVTYEI